MNRIIPNMIFLSFCILYLFQSINLSQNQNLEFEHITIDHGLSNSDVHDIIQDSLGFLWIATEDGFNKYDGYKFTVYKHDPDNPFSLSHNSTYRLLNSYIEGRQIIWIGTFGGGLNAFDVKTERFIHWKKIEQNKSWDSKNNSFCSVLYDKVTKEYKMWYTESVRKIGLAVIKLNKSINWIDWKKYPLNPILSDSIFLSTPTVIYHNGTYHMWYSGYFADKGFSIGYASSPDGIKWTKYINNPVLKSGGIGGWIGENCLLYPNVVHDGKQFHMWYSGYDVNWEVSEIGHAISKDGINWKKDRKNPVLRRGHKGNWDEYLTSSASVIFNNDRFHLWYRGKGSTYREWSKFGYATSLDGSNWLKYHEPVFTSVTGFESDLWHLNVIYDGSNYQMFYTEGWIDNFILRHAESKDGVNWERTSDNRIWKKANSGLTTNNVISLCMDNRGALWLGASQNPGGLNKFTLPSKSEFLRMFEKNGRKIPESFKNYLIGVNITDIKKDNNRNLWIAGNTNGIYSYNFEKNEFHNYKIDSKITLPSSFNAFSLLYDNSGNIWTGLGNGDLLKFEMDYSKDSITILDTKRYNSTQQGNITHIFEFSNRMLMLSTEKGGINIFDKKTTKFTNHYHNQLDPTSISRGVIDKIFRDNSGIFWICSEEGISKYNPYRDKFSHYHNRPSDQNIIQTNHIGSVLETELDGNKILWIGTLGSGLTKIDRKTNQCTYYKHEPSINNSLAGDDVYSLYEDSEGYIWLGAGNALQKYNPIQNKFITYMKNEPNNSSNITGWEIRKIYEDKSGTLWLGSDHGLGIIDKKKESIRWLLMLKRPPVRAIFDFKETDDSTLWVGMENMGLRKYNTITGAMVEYLYNPNDKNSLSSNNVNCITGTVNNGKQILWIGTSQGLNKAILSADDKLKFIHYTENDGLPNNIIYGILEDERGDLWISTNYCLCKFDPNSEIFVIFDKGDGLPGNEFTLNSSFKSKRGEMFFGGKNGLTYFFPDSIIENKNIPNIVVTDFQLFNEHVPVLQTSSEKSNKYYLSKHISYLDTLVLSYKENVFSFEFSALDYQNPKKNRYAYMMEGFDKDWTHSDSEKRTAVYTNLDPGEYIFKVKGSNNDGYWNNAGTSLLVIITPPWWATTWMYSVYILVILMIFYGIWHFQMSRVRLKHAVELKDLEARKYHEIDKMKSKFLANISHEFRTPLTLIKGPVERLLDNESVDDPRKIYRIIKRNSERLLHLINELLDISKLESGKMKLSTQKSDIVSFTKAIVMSFESLAEKKEIQMSISSSSDIIEYYFDKEKMQKILTNLLSNAFKFTPEGGKIIVTIEKIVIDQKIYIKIVDSGIGIPSKELSKIFDRFYQVDGSNNKSYQGTGIGLSLTKELVEIHHGKIEVESKEGEGTSFTLTFPLGRNHLNDEEMIYDEPDLVIKEKEDEDNLETNVIEDGRNPLLLVIEDNRDVRDFIISILKNNYILVKAHDGEEGYKIALEKMPDLIISDIMMPRLTGDKMCERLKNNPITSHIPIILLTAKSSDEDKINGLDIGADDYLIKPFNDKELLARINNLIVQRRNLREKYLREADINPIEVAVTSLDKRFIERVIEIVEENISNPEISVEQLSDDLMLSRTQLYRKFSSILGEKPKDFIRKYRIKRAADLIKQNFGNITDVAYEVGFTSLSYFSKCFKETYHQSPHEFEKNYLNKQK